MLRFIAPSVKAAAGWLWQPRNPIFLNVTLKRQRLNPLQPRYFRKLLTLSKGDRNVQKTHVGTLAGPASYSIRGPNCVGEPSGSCPPGFTLEMAMEHDDHPHHHVGTSADQNGDGFICMKPVTSTGKIHVHIDNDLP